MAVAGGGAVAAGGRVLVAVQQQQVVAVILDNSPSFSCGPMGNSIAYPCYIYLFNVDKSTRQTPIHIITSFKKNSSTK